MYSTPGVSGVSATTSCASHTLSNSVRAPIDSSFAGFQPRHAGAQLRADLLDRVRQIRFQQLRILAAAALVLGDPLTRKFTLLNLGENLAHFLLGRLVHHARSARQIAVLCGLADEAMHLRDAALMQEIDDQLELMQAFVIGNCGLVA